MEVMIRCKSPMMAFCPKCACRINLSKDMQSGHCGHCGCVMSVEITEEISIAPEQTEEAFTQISLFDM